MRIFKDRLNTTQEAGSKLKFELYKAAMKVLERHRHPMAWKNGWLTLRAIGRELLGREGLDHEYAEEIILNYARKTRYKLKPVNKTTNFLSPSSESEPPWQK